MDKDLNSLKKWFKNLGFELDGNMDEVLKKLIPPQRRDMWRSVFTYVLPKEEVDLIKKSILYHKIQKLHKPLMARVETKEDLSNALKYEELLTKYNKIQKEIKDVKTKNTTLISNLNENIKVKKNLINNIELKQNVMYVAKYKTESYKKLIEVLNEMSNICNHFAIEANEAFIKTDYEDSLIKCFAEVDDAKESGVMNNGIGIGKELCNVMYEIIRDKSPATLLQTVEENLIDYINRSNIIINEATMEHNDNENVINELLPKLFQKQLEQESKLSSLLTEKGCVINRLNENITLVKNDIISQYKLKYMSYTDEELLEFKRTLKENFKRVIINSFGCCKLNEFQYNSSFEENPLKMLNDVLEKNSILNEKIVQKKKIIDEMSNELNGKKSDFGLTEVQTIMDGIAENYLKIINNSVSINQTVSLIKDSSTFDVQNIKKITMGSYSKSNIQFCNLQNVKQNCAIIDVVDEMTTKFKQLNNNIFTENNFDEITRKESSHKSEFDSILSRMESKIMELDSGIEDCKLIAEIGTKIIKRI